MITQTAMIMNMNMNMIIRFNITSQFIRVCIIANIKTSFFAVGPQGGQKSCRPAWGRPVIVVTAAVVLVVPKHRCLYGVELEIFWFCGLRPTM